MELVTVSIEVLTHLKIYITGIMCGCFVSSEDPFSRRIAKSTLEMMIFQLQPLLKQSTPSINSGPA